MRKGRTGALVVSILLLSSLLAGQDRSKKAYELIYEDIQALKKQVFALEEKIGQAAAGIEALRTELGDLRSEFKSLQAGQSVLQENVKNVPSQYQYLLDRIEQINLLLDKISLDLLTIKGSPSQATGPAQGAKPGGAPPVTEKKPAEAKKEPPAPESKAAPTRPQPTNLSPQEVYNTAYSDYLKGNFELAVDGFKMYRESFPDSPLADNALYWIGECDYSQRKFNEAIDVFNDLILNYPRSDKTPAAYLKKGLALAELKKKDEALVVFRLLISKYPLEEESKIAQEKIKELAGK
jgi:tol-pal system protein YbgF